MTNFYSFSEVLTQYQQKNQPNKTKSKQEFPRVDWSRASSVAVPNECLCASEDGHKRGFYLLSHDRESRGEIVACICTREEHNWQVKCLERCGISAYNMQRFTFDTWVEVLNPGLTTAMKNVKAYAEGRVRVPWVVLWGDSGLGKTHLAQAAAALVASRGTDTRYLTAYDMESQLKIAIETQNVQQVVREYAEVPFLVLDDVGTQLKSDFVAGEFHAILDKRYIEGRRTLITLNPEGFQSLGKRLLSRITDVSQVQAIKMVGQDVRPMLNQQ